MSLCGLCFLPVYRQPCRQCRLAPTDVLSLSLPVHSQLCRQRRLAPTGRQRRLAPTDVLSLCTANLADSADWHLLTFCLCLCTANLADSADWHLLMFCLCLCLCTASFSDSADWHLQMFCLCLCTANLADSADWHLLMFCLCLCLCTANLADSADWHLLMFCFCLRLCTANLADSADWHLLMFCFCLCLCTANLADSAARRCATSTIHSQQWAGPFLPYLVSHRGQTGHSASRPTAGPPHPRPQTIHSWPDPVTGCSSGHYGSITNTSTRLPSQGPGPCWHDPSGSDGLAGQGAGHCGSPRLWCCGTSSDFAEWGGVRR